MTSRIAGRLCRRRFSSLTTAQWHLSVESNNPVEIYVDGQRVLHGSGDAHESTFEASSGPHRVLAKFGRAAAPLRIAITPAVEQARTPLTAKLSSQEATYLLAADHYSKNCSAVDESPDDTALICFAAASYSPLL